MDDRERTKQDLWVPIGMKLNEFVDRIFCVNLDRRTDRWGRCLEVFQQHNLDVERFSAVDGFALGLVDARAHRMSPGAIGCSRSHLEIIKIARDRKYKSVLIFDDDIELDEDFNEKFSKCVEKLPADWELLYLGGINIESDKTVEHINDHIDRVERMAGTYAIIVRDSMYDMVIKELTAELRWLDANYARFQKQHKSYIVVPHLIWVRSDFSDIYQRFTDTCFTRPGFRVSDRSMLGRWESWYSKVGALGSIQYGDSVTYNLAAKFMSDVSELEDWGCGTAAFKKFYGGKYIGIDGTNNPFVDKVVDLRNYRSSVDGIMLRHVLEHNYDWKGVLENALLSFKKKLCLVIFTPFVEATHEIAHNGTSGVDVPDIAFNKQELESFFSDLQWRVETRDTRTQYKIEHIYYIEKRWKKSV